jgi:hypothetical protein
VLVGTGWSANASRSSSSTNTPSGTSRWKCTLPVDQAAEPLHERDRSGLRGAEAALACKAPLPRSDRAHREVADPGGPRGISRQPAARRYGATAAWDEADGVRGGMGWRSR